MSNVRRPQISRKEEVMNEIPNLPGRASDAGLEPRNDERRWNMLVSEAIDNCRAAVAVSNRSVSRALIEAAIRDLQLALEVL